MPARSLPPTACRLRMSGAFLLVVALLFLSLSPVTAQTPLPAASPADSARADSLSRANVSRADTTLIIKHNFNHKQQIITGSIIMACMATIMVVMNNYNPQVQQE